MWKSAFVSLGDHARGLVECALGEYVMWPKKNAFPEVLWRRKTLHLYPHIRHYILPWNKRDRKAQPANPPVEKSRADALFFLFVLFLGRVSSCSCLNSIWSIWVPLLAGPRRGEKVSFFRESVSEAPTHFWPGALLLWERTLRYTRNLFLFPFHVFFSWASISSTARSLFEDFFFIFYSVSFLSRWDVVSLCAFVSCVRSNYVAIRIRLIDTLSAMHELHLRNTLLIWS